MQRSFFLIAVFTVSFLAVTAQVADLKTHVAMKDSIISKFNRKDFQGIYSMSDTIFRKEVSQASFLTFLENVAQAGVMESSALSEDLGDIKYFHIKMPAIQVELRISVTPANRFQVFAISRTEEYDTAYVKAIATDNPLKTSLDSAIDRSVRKHMRNKNAAGISLGIIKNGQVYRYHYGEVEKGKGVLPSSGTFYEIGSITKTVTGIILAHAVQDKKVKLDDDIRKYFAGSYPNLEFKGQPVRVVHLSNHSSGLPGLPDDFFKQPYDSLDPYVSYSEERLMEALHRVKLDTFPGVNYYYSNWGVSLLGRVLEKAYAMPFDKLVERFITGPMNMRDTKFVLSEKEMERFAKGHTDKGRQTPYWTIKAFAAAGALRSTLDDMMKYLENNIHPKSEAVRFSHELTRGTYLNGNGLGWFVQTSLGGHRYYQHTGGTGGFATKILAIPEIDAGFVLLTNNSISGNLSREILYHVTNGNIR